MEQLDPTIVNLARSIKYAETGDRPDAYEAVGDNGTSHGAYQFQEPTWQSWAGEFLGDSNAAKTKENQNKVAYSRIKSWKDAGYNPAQIASMWNSGSATKYKDGTGVGHNAKLGVDYNVPGYVSKVSQFYKNISSGNHPTDNLDTNQPQDTTTQDTAVQPNIESEHKKSLYEKISNTIEDIFPGAKVGENIGTLVGYLLTPKEERQNYDLSHPTTLQTLGDVAQGALMVGAPGFGKEASVGARIGSNALAGAGFGLTGAVAEGKPFKDVLKDTAIGGVAGGALGAVFEAGGKILSNIAGKSAEEIIATAEKDVPKLTARQQKFWYQNASKDATKYAQQASTAAETAGKEAIQQTKNDIIKMQQDLGTSTTEKALSMKEPAKNLIKEASDTYEELVEEATQKAGTSLSATVQKEKLEEKLSDIVSKAAGGRDEAVYKSLADEIKNLGGEEGEITNQQLLDKAKEIMSSVRQGAKSGTTSYTSAEYDAMTKYRTIMEILSDNGVDMSEANKFWREWVPVRNQIYTQIRPFDEVTGKTPFAKTLTKASQTANTAQQTIAKAEAKAFVSEFEKRLKLQEGELTAEFEQQATTIDKAKLKKLDIERTVKEIKTQIREDKRAALKEMSLKQYDLEEKMRKQKIMLAVIGGVLGIKFHKQLGTVLGL